MAKLEQRLHGNFDDILSRLHHGILDGSISASFEEQSDFHCGSVRCAVRVYERYSYLGQNRVSLQLTLFGSAGDYYLTAITSGGSQAVFFKLNTLGEEAFLDKVREIISTL